MKVYLTAKNGRELKSLEDIKLVVAATNLAFNIARPLTGDPARKEEAVNQAKFHPYLALGPQFLGPCEDVKQRMSLIAKELKIAAGEFQKKSQGQWWQW